MNFLKKTVSMVFVLTIALIDLKIVGNYEIANQTQKYKVISHKKTGAAVLDLSSIHPEEIYEINIEETPIIPPSQEVQDEKIEEKIPEPAVEPEPVQELVPETVTEPESPVESPAVSEESNSDLASSIVETALQYKGYRYVSGGASPETGFDCSGFTKYIYGLFGINLNRVSGDQAYNGTPITKDELRPGDLVLFSYYGSESIGHSGIYIGNGQFVHAANSSRGVVTDTLESGYYLENYVTARRLF